VTPFFWILLGLGLFVLVLALQMRMIVSVALRRALAAKFGGLPTDTAWRVAVVEAAAPFPASEAALHLAHTYPAPLSHLRLARRTCLIAPLFILLVLAAGRLVLGVI
jgi:hypothetical protein